MLFGLFPLPIWCRRAILSVQQPPHAGHQIGLSRFHRQVKMAGPQTICVDLKAGLLAHLGQRFEKILPLDLLRQWSSVSRQMIFIEDGGFQRRCKGLLDAEELKRKTMP